MASKRGQRNRGGGGSRSSISILVFFSLLGTLIFFVGRGLSTSTSISQYFNSYAQILDFFFRPDLIQHDMALLSNCFWASSTLKLGLNSLL